MDLRKIDKTELESLLSDMILLDSKSKLILGEDASSIIKIKVRLSSRTAEDNLLEQFIDKICLYREVSKDTILAKSKKGDLPFARHMLATLLKTYTLLSLKSIGKKMNGRHHTTILHSIQTHINEMETSSSYRSDYNRILEELRDDGIIGFEKKSVLTIGDIQDEIRQRNTKEA